MDAKVAENKQVVLKGYIESEPRETDMEIKVGKAELKVPTDSGAVLVKNLYLSCDPYMCVRMRGNHDDFVPPFVIGKPLQGLGISKVIDSDNQDFKLGDVVSGMVGWEEYTLIQNPEQLRRIQRDDDIPLSFHLGLLGMPGLTAYAGFYEICSPKKGDYVFVSAAAGAVGQLVGQFAKLHGCIVVGSAGSSKKVDLLKNKLGFDDAFNYKEEPNYDAALKRYFPEGIDVYFDNVGGPMLEAVLLNMRNHGRIAVCGMISLYGTSVPCGIHNLYNLVVKAVKMVGFWQSDYLHLYPQFVAYVTSSYKEGRIVYVEDVKDGIEGAPAAFVGLFAGKNVGKQAIRVAMD